MVEFYDRGPTRRKMTRTELTGYVYASVNAVESSVERGLYLDPLALDPVGEVNHMRMQVEVKLNL